jgi:hypothetical protein
VPYTARSMTPGRSTDLHMPPLTAGARCAQDVVEAAASELRPVGA